MIGHAVANGHAGFPGDPLPSGHLGTPANLAFWGSMYDEDEDSFREALGPKIKVIDSAALRAGHWT